MLCKPSSYANYGNSNLGYQINIQGEGAGAWDGDLQKCDYPIQGRIQIVKLSHPPYPLDVDPMAQIGVSIVCIRRWFA